MCCCCCCDVQTDADIEAIMSDAEVLDGVEDLWSLESVYFTSGNTLTPSATVTLKDADGATYTDAAVGVGAVDAVTHPAPPPLSAAAGCAVRMARSTDRWVAPCTGGQVDRADMRHSVRAG